MVKLLLVIIVFVVVFNPKKIPDLIRHISLVFEKINAIKQSIYSIWDDNVQKQLILDKNIKKAQAVEQANIEKQKKQ